MSEWQPIETAPKDGTTILAWGPYSEPATYQWRTNVRLVGWVPVWDGFLVIEYQSDFGTEYKTADPLTHWMPLPQPPHHLSGGAG